MDDDLNASVVQVPPTGGVFGRRNYLVLGLPLLQALTPDEFHRAVLLASGETSVSAAQELLGAAQATLTERLDEAWRREAAETWEVLHDQARQDRLRLEQLERESETLGDEEAVELARLTKVYHGGEAAEPHYRRILERDPANASARLGVGELLLARGDDMGLRELEQAMQADASLVLTACQTAMDFLRGRGRNEEADAYKRRFAEFVEMLGDASEERASVSIDDELEPHGLPREVIWRLRERVAEYDVAEAYLARKRVEHLGDPYPLFVLVVVPKQTKPK